MPAKLICIESLDGGGKSTQVRKIKQFFKNQNKTVKHIHFPMYGHNDFSEMVSKFLRGDYGSNEKVDPIFLSNIYAMDRYMYKEELLKHIEEYDIVIIDRYVFSNVAYQGSKIKDDKNVFINKILDFEFNFLNLPYPDVIIFLDVNINEIEKRLIKRRNNEKRDYLKGKEDIHEKDIEFQKNVYQIYMMMNHTKNFNIIKTTLNEKMLTPNEVFDNYKDLII